MSIRIVCSIFLPYFSQLIKNYAELLIEAVGEFQEVLCEVFSSVGRLG